jgi:hypothetical protein
MGKATGLITLSGGTGGGTGSLIAPLDVTGIVVTGFIDPVSAAITLSVGVTPPVGGTFIGCHVYLEDPDQSSVPAFTVGVTALGGTAAVVGTWLPIDCGDQVYIAPQQPWTITVPGPPGVDPTVDTPCRIYCVAFSTTMENKLVQANQTGPTPNQTFTLVSLASGTPTSGTNITGLTVASGAQVGIVATALAPVNVTGKLQTPVEVIVTDTPTTQNWGFELVLTYFGQDPTVPANQYVLSGIETQAGPVQAGADGISVPHSFVLDTPTAVTSAVVWLIAGLVDASGNFQGNNLVPGITPSFPITFGSTIGTTDASAIMAATIAATMAIVGGLFGVAAAGITNPYLGTGAVATLNIQALAVTNPILAALAVQAANLANSSVTSVAIANLAVQAANLANSSVTSVAIANLAVGTAAMQLLSVDSTIIANAAVSNAKIVNATITNASIALATIAGANIGSATITQGNIALLSVGTAQIQNLAVTDAKVINLSASKITAGTISATISITSPNINGGAITGASLVLNLNSVTTSITNTAVIGLTAGLAVADNTNSAQAFVHAHGFGLLDSSGSNNFAVNTIVIGPTKYAKLTMYNTGTAKIDLDANNLTLTINGQVVVKNRQTGPGAPSGFADSAAQTWCQNLYNALSTSGHGLVN